MEGRQAWRDPKTDKIGIGLFEGNSFKSWVVQPEFDEVTELKHGYWITAKGFISSFTNSVAPMIPFSYWHQYNIIDQKDCVISSNFEYAYMISVGDYRLYCYSNDVEKCHAKKKNGKREESDIFKKPLKSSIYQLDRYTDISVMEIIVELEKVEDLKEVIQGVNKYGLKESFGHAIDNFRDSLIIELERRELSSAILKL